MKSLLRISAVLVFIAVLAWVYKGVGIAQTSKVASRYAFEDGDIVFQSTPSNQCKAIKEATHSEWSHCGILFQQEGKWMVLEAMEPVQITSFYAWKERSGGFFAVKRLKDTALLSSDANRKKLLDEGFSYVGKKYDIYFDWSDKEIYCSELVWKMYEQALGVKLCSLKKLKEYDLSGYTVRELMKERYGSMIPYSQEMVAPSDIFNSELLTEVSLKRKP